MLAYREVPGEGLTVDQDGVSDAAVRAALVGEDADGLVDAGLVESLVEVLGFGQRVAAVDENLAAQVGLVGFDYPVDDGFGPVWAGAVVSTLCLASVRTCTW